ncbi:MAG TPA: cytochrome c [Rhodopila sp.]|nr:cytochrome c [Rhodopila sp.]
MRAIKHALVAAALAAIGTAASVAQPTGNPARGKHLFMADGCYECHGTVGQGGAGPRLAPDPLPADAIASYIRTPANVMPPYVEKVLDDQDVRDIHAYLTGIKPPRPVKDIPLLAQ